LCMEANDQYHAINTYAAINERQLETKEKHLQTKKCL